ncbi:MAG: hypothetical protein AAFZ63_11165 [Bacteroidota bacterium]
MANLKLASSDIKQLLATYESKQRQLQFELEQTKRMIRNFKSALPNLEAAEAAQIASIAEATAVIEEIAIPAAAAAPKKKGRKPRAASTITPAVAPLKTSKKTSKKDRSTGYRLSEYDLLVFKALEDTGAAMLTAEITDFIVASQGKDADAAKVQVMVVRSLQKLANRRDDIRKVSYDGRGRAYALPNWVNGKGELKRKHARKG